MNDHPTLLKETEKFILELFRDKLPPQCVYHNYQHTLDRVSYCIRFANSYPMISNKELELLLIAAWFLDSGYIYTNEHHLEKSKEITLKFLKTKKAEEHEINQIIDYIDQSDKTTSASTILAKILSDANSSDIGLETYEAKASLLRIELASYGKIINREDEWIKEQISFIRSHEFLTEEANRLLGEQAKQNLQHLEHRLQKLERKKEKEKKKDTKKKEKDPRRGIQTMFRSVYRSHINLSSIADNKANMMIRVNSFIISIALTLVGAKFSFLGTSFKENQIVIYPIISLLFTGLITIIFAILSAKPHITHKIHSSQDMLNKNSSLLFFGNYTALTLDSFKDGMHTLFKGRDDVYDSMMTDLYWLGKVLTRKYRLITISYMVFLTGLIFTALLTVYVVIHLKREY